MLFFVLTEVICFLEKRIFLIYFAGTSAPTPAPQPTTQPPQPTLGPTTASPSKGGNSESKHFDAASFIGGMVLSLGVVAICFFGYKFYKSRADKNYHTL